MSTPESNKKSISKLQDDAVNGEGILGGGKSAPVITVEWSDTPVDVIIPTTISPVDNSVDYANDGNVRPVDGPNAIG